MKPVLCRDCRHFQPDREGPRGACGRWKTGYDVLLANLAPNDCLVEDDEGWGMSVGPLFGCVLGERKEDGELTP